MILADDSVTVMSEVTITGFMIIDGVEVLAPQKSVYVYDKSNKRMVKIVEEQMKKDAEMGKNLKMFKFEATTLCEDAPTVIAGISTGKITVSIKSLAEKASKRDSLEDYGIGSVAELTGSVAPTETVQDGECSDPTETDQDDE
jgi:hypothetical protein